MIGYQRCDGGLGTKRLTDIAVMWPCRQALGIDMDLSSGARHLEHRCGR